MLSPYIMPVWLQRFIYSISLSIKEILVFVLPLIIFNLFLSGLLKINDQAFGLLSILFPAICISNITALLFAYLYSSPILKCLDLNFTQVVSSQKLLPLWDLHLIRWCPNELALGLALLISFILIKQASQKLPIQLLCKTLTHTSEKLANFFLKKFLQVLPLFIFGSLLKLQHDGLLMLLVKNYANVFLLIACAQISYIALLYILGNNFSINNTLKSIKIMLPAAFAGFVSMSSAAALPVTLKQTGYNLKSSTMANLIVPATVNIHLLADCIAIPILALAIMQSFTTHPNFTTYLVFAGYGALAKFAAAAVPGGSIIVIAPVLEQQLGFNSEMISLITTLYIMSDSLNTSLNVMANGGFAILINKILIKYKNKTQKSYSAICANNDCY